jgi:RHS repeat-associated protein
MRVATVDRELSLHTMWHAFRVSNFVAQKHVVINHGVGRDLLNARYYNPNQGQFISQDASFLAVGDPALVKQVTGQDQRTFLSDPQVVNAYNYGRNNPITQKDPNGNATYIWDNGAGMTGIDTWNRNTYYQYRDTALLSSNASLGESNRGNTPMFFNQVKPGGPWDYKRNAENRGFYFFNGKLVSVRPKTF